MSNGNQNPSTLQENIVNLSNIKDLGKIVSWSVIIPFSFLFLSDGIGIGLLSSAGENWGLMVLFGVLALLIAGPLDLGLGLSKLFRNNPDRDQSINRSPANLLWDFFSNRSFWSGLGATLLVITIWSVIYFCDRYNLYGSARSVVKSKPYKMNTDPNAKQNEKNTSTNSLLLDAFGKIKESVARPFLSNKGKGLSERLRDSRELDETEQLVYLPSYLILGSLPLLAIMGLCVVFPNKAADSSRELQTDSWTARLRYQVVEFLGYLAGGLGAFLIAATAVLAAFRFNTSALHGDLGKFVEDHGLIGVISRVKGDELAHVILFIAIFSVIFSLVLRCTPDLSPGFGISLVLTLVALIYFVVKIIEPSWNLPLIGGAIFLLIIINSSRYKYRYANMGSQYENTYDLHEIEMKIEEGNPNPNGDPNLLNDEKVLNAWATGISGRGGTGKPKLLLVAVTGGAYRASFWTTVVLERLSNDFPGFFDHVRLITGASGGMVGAAYAATLVEHAGKGDEAAKMATERLDGDTNRNSLTPVITQLIRADLPLSIRPAFWPFGPQKKDRGKTLEDQWKTLDITFESLKKGEEEGWRPSLIISPMIVETGRRLLFSNLDLYGLTDEQARERKGISVDAGDGTKSPLNSGGAGRRISRSAVEFFRGFPDLKGGSEAENKAFKLKTAVRMNAAFPFVSPAVSLPVNPPRRVVDAGYYDNYGVDLATAWIYHNRDWLETHTSGVALIQIRAYSSESIRKRVWVGPRDAPPSLIDRLFNRLVVGVQALTTPLAGVGSARQWSMSYRNDQTIQRVYEYFNFVSRAAKSRNQSATERPKPASVSVSAVENESVEAAASKDTAIDSHPDLGWFETFVFENPIPFGMNWFISKAEIERMRHALDTCPIHMPVGEECNIDNCKQLKYFSEWWMRSETETRIESNAI